MSRDIWGPQVWKLFHRMADVSNRKDVFLIWNSLLRHTTSVLPCELCRTHMSEYWLHHRFIPKRWEFMTGEEVRNHIRQRIYEFHSHVNSRLEKPDPSLTPVSELPDRIQTLAEINTAYEEICRLWTHIPNVSEWKRAATMLIQLVSGGPN